VPGTSYNGGNISQRSGHAIKYLEENQEMVLWEVHNTMEDLVIVTFVATTPSGHLSAKLPYSGL